MVRESPKTIPNQASIIAISRAGVLVTTEVEERWEAIRQRIGSVDSVQIAESLLTQNFSILKTLENRIEILQSSLNRMNETIKELQFFLGVVESGDQSSKSLELMKICSKGRLSPYLEKKILQAFGLAAAKMWDQKAMDISECAEALWRYLFQLVTELEWEMGLNAKKYHRINAGFLSIYKQINLLKNTSLPAPERKLIKYCRSAGNCEYGVSRKKISE